MDQRCAMPFSPDVIALFKILKKLILLLVNGAAG